MCHNGLWLLDVFRFVRGGVGHTSRWAIMMSADDLEIAALNLPRAIEIRRRFRRRRFVAAILCLTIALGWLLSATWGVNDVTSWAHRASQAIEAPDRDLQRLDFDPDVRPHPYGKRVPWYYVGNASSPCPFVVAIDCAHQVGPTAGQRSRYYVLWLFGFKLPIHQSVDWMS